MIGVDTNLLVYAHRQDSAWHSEAASALRSLAEDRAQWAIPWPCIHEFLAIVTQRGELASDDVDRPGPDPAMFGLPTEDDGSRDDPLMANIRGGAVSRVPDLNVVRAAPTRVVIAVGVESGGPVDGEIAGRSAYAVAAALGRDAVLFPSGHQGFLGGEFGQTGEPEEFAAKLQQVLLAA